MTFELLSRIIVVALSLTLNGCEILERKTTVAKISDSLEASPEPTPSDRICSIAPSSKLAIYATVYSHNEDDDRYAMLVDDGVTSLDTQFDNYRNYRDSVIELAKMIKNEGAVYNFQPDWKFLEAAKRFELNNICVTDTSRKCSQIDAGTPRNASTLFNDSNGKNLLRYLKEDLAVEIDPHSHECCGYNYADVAYLISLFDVTPTNIVGGYLKFADTASGSKLGKLYSTLTSTMYPGYQWTPEILWGGAANHIQQGAGKSLEQLFSGVYRPKGVDAPMEHDPNGKLVEIGVPSWGFDWNRLLSTIDSSQDPDKNSKIYTFSLECFELNIYQEVFQNKTSSSIAGSQKLAECRSRIQTINNTYASSNEREVIWKHFTDVAKLWINNYCETPNTLMIDTTPTSSSSPSPSPSLSPTPTSTSGSCMQSSYTYFPPPPKNPSAPALCCPSGVTPPNTQCVQASK